VNNETLHHNQLQTESCELVNDHNQLKTESCELVNNENRQTVELETNETQPCELVNYDNLKTPEMKAEYCEFTDNEIVDPDHLKVEPCEMMNNENCDPVQQQKTEPSVSVNNENVHFDDFKKTEPCEFIDNDLHSTKVETDFNQFSNIELEAGHEQAFYPGDQWSGWNEEAYIRHLVPNFQGSNFRRGESVKMDLGETEQVLEYYQFMQYSSLGSSAVPRYKADFARCATNSNDSIPAGRGTIRSPVVNFEVDDTLHHVHGGLVKMEEGEDSEEICDVVKTGNDVSTTRNP
jgi:hypothetical protein